MLQTAQQFHFDFQLSPDFYKWSAKPSTKLKNAKKKKRPLNEVFLYDTQFRIPETHFIANMKQFSDGTLQKMLHMKSSVELCLSYSGLKDEGLWTLVNYLCRSGCLITKLDLSGNQITDAGCTAIAKLIRKCCPKVLILDANQITYKGCDVIASALQGNTQLVELSLSANNLRDIGCSSIMKAMENCDVKSLTIALNQIGDLGAQYIGEVLFKNTTVLEKLCIFCNQITSLEEIVKALKNVNVKLQELQYIGNPIRDTSLFKDPQRCSTTFVEQFKKPLRRTEKFADVEFQF